MSFLEGIVEKVASSCGMDVEDAEILGDFVSFGANVATGNYAGAAADGLDVAEVDDDVPWLAQGLEIAGEGPITGGAPGEPSAASAAALKVDLGLQGGVSFRV